MGDMTSVRNYLIFDRYGTVGFAEYIYANISSFLILFLIFIIEV